METEEAQRPTTNVGSRWRTRGHGPYDDVEVRIAYGFVNAPDLVRHLDGVDMTAFWVTVEDRGWRLTVKGNRRGKHVVAYFHAGDFRDLLAIGVTSLDTSRAMWWPDSRPIRP